MTEYKVIIEITAVSDLRGILHYIKSVLKEPVTAKRIYHSIKMLIITLEQMPFRCPLVRDETFAARGLRKLSTENYSVFYTVDETLNEVHVLRILYNRREWQYLL